MSKNRYYHPDYRQAEVSAIVQALDQGQSVSVVGPPSVGKTNLLHFLDQERLAVHDANSPWTRYAPQSTRQGAIIAIHIDPNALLPPLTSGPGQVAAAAWPGFELLVHRTTITPQLYPVYKGELYQDAETNAELIDDVARLQDRFENAHPDVTDFDDPLHAHLALRHLESILHAALASYRMQGSPIRVAYFLDEFERLLMTMPDYFFIALRSIRDRFKYNVMFVTFTRNSLPYLARERLAALEPFLELFNDTVVHLRPFNDDDSWRMIEQLEDRTVSKDDYGLGLVIRATGGFAGLLRAGFKHAEKLARVQAPDYAQAVQLAAARLLAEENVRAECETLLRGLNDDELRVLHGVATNRPDLNSAVVQELVHKSLLRLETPPASGSGRSIIPPLLAAYLPDRPQPAEARPSAPPATLPEG